jgi:hypothetical protein
VPGEVWEGWLQILASQDVAVAGNYHRLGLIVIDKEVVDGAVGLQSKITPSILDLLIAELSSATSSTFTSLEKKDGVW